MYPDLLPDDLHRLQHAMEVLLSPLSYEHTDAWRASVNTALKQLVGAEQALFLLPRHDVPFAYSTELPDHFVGSLDELYTREVDRLLHRCGHELWERAVALGAHDDRLLWKPIWAEYQKSAYYQEWKYPHGLHNTAGISTPYDEGRPGALSICQVLVYRDDPRQKSYGEKELTLLRLLLPSFRAGIATLRRLSAYRDGLFRTLDATGQSLQLFDPDGRALHRTPALATMLQQEPERTRLDQEIARTALCLARMRRMRHTADVPTAPIQQRVATRQSRYRIQGSLLPVGQPGHDYTVLVAVECMEPAWLSAEALRAQFGLTRREADVARLLAQRKRNLEIAKALGVTEHTARRHTERVLSKLGIHSRDEVQRVIRS